MSAPIMYKSTTRVAYRNSPNVADRNNEVWPCPAFRVVANPVVVNENWIQDLANGLYLPLVIENEVIMQRVILPGQGEGHYVEEKYCGGLSWVVGVVVLPCIFLCPLDSRPKWVSHVPGAVVLEGDEVTAALASSSSSSSSSPASSNSVPHLVNANLHSSAPHVHHQGAQQMPPPTTIATTSPPSAPVHPAPPPPHLQPAAVAQNTSPPAQDAGGGFKFCPHCGSARTSAEGKFCTNCGKAFGA